jgi:hypothetical protein
MKYLSRTATSAVADDQLNRIRFYHFWKTGQFSRMFGRNMDTYKTLKKQGFKELCQGSVEKTYTMAQASSKIQLVLRLK